MFHKFKFFSEDYTQEKSSSRNSLEFLLRFRILNISGLSNHWKICGP
jgi:hypothetical protein